MSAPVSGPVVFTARGLRAGFVSMIPLGLGAATFGLLFGFLADQRGLSALETLLMSGLVFAGASQLLALELWSSPPSVLVLTIGALGVNIRFMMMAAALREWLAPLPPFKAYGSLAFLVDMNFAMSLAEIRRGGRDAAYFLGGGLLLWLVWVTSTAIGHVFGHLLREPERFGLDFLVAGCFIAMAVPLYEKRRSLLPWLAAAGVAALVWQLVPGSWYLLAGTLAGALVGVVLDERR